MRKGKFNSILCKCVIICALALTTAACSDSEPKGMTASEEYDIAFVTRFGIPDRDHTWSMARDNSVVVLTPNGANEVKVYGMQENEYRLLAHYSNVGSMAQIKFVAPSDMQTVMVSADGSLCEAEVGGMVSIAKAASRTDADPNVEQVGDKFYVKTSAHKATYTAESLYNHFYGMRVDKGLDGAEELWNGNKVSYITYPLDFLKYIDQDGYKIVRVTKQETIIKDYFSYVVYVDKQEIVPVSYSGEFYQCYAAGDEYEYERKAYTLQDDRDGKGPYFIKIDDTPYTWILAAEDLGAKDDWDFNDVVLGVTCVATGEGYDVKVTGLAAGGTLPVKIMYNGRVLIPEDRDEEFHSWFGESSTSYKTSDMINTGAGKTTDNLSTVTFQTSMPLTAEWNANAVNRGNLRGFSIVVEGNAGEMTGADKDSLAPQMICVDGSWKWPTERVAIDDAYPSDADNKKDGFTDWVKNPNATAWIQNAVGSKVFTAKK